MESPSCIESEGAPRWCNLPRLGEADHPGPDGDFDDAQVGEWVHDDRQPCPGDMDWQPDVDTEVPDDIVYPMEQRQSLTPLGAADAWLANHHKGPVNKKPNFEGEKPGWVFKLGDRGLGYYQDVGRVQKVYLYPEVAPSGGTLPVTLELSKLLPDEPPNVASGARQESRTVSRI